MDWKPPIKPLRTSPVPSASPTLTGPIRRSISCPRSIASLSSPSEVRALATRPSFPMATSLVRLTTNPPRSHSLSRSGSTHRVPHSNSLGTIHSTMVRWLQHSQVALFQLRHFIHDRFRQSWNMIRQIFSLNAAGQCRKSLKRNLFSSCLIQVVLFPVALCPPGTIEM